MKPFEIIIPCKRFASGKSRLSAVLKDAQRSLLCRTLFERTVRIAHDAAGKGKVSVTSADEGVLALADKLGAHPIREPGRDLNEALHVANEARLAATRVPLTLVVLPIDLPLLTPERVEEAVTQTTEFGIAPDLHGMGTNLLVLGADIRRDFRFAFGADSFAKHQALAERLGAFTKPLLHREFAFDLDRPEDFQALPERLRDSIVRSFVMA